MSKSILVSFSLGPIVENSLKTFSKILLFMIFLSIIFASAFRDKPSSIEDLVYSGFSPDFIPRVIILTVNFTGLLFYFKPFLRRT